MSASPQQMAMLIAQALAQMPPAQGAPSQIWTPTQTSTSGAATPDDVQWLTANVTGLASTNVNGQSQIQIDSGYDFYWFATTHQADSAGASQTDSSRLLPLVLLLINDSSASRNLSNVAQPLENVSGTGKEPYRLARPRLFPRNTLVTFTWTSYVASGTTYSNIYLTLHGYRIRWTS